jgi:hypothetical protein
VSLRKQLVKTTKVLHLAALLVQDRSYALLTEAGYEVQESQRTDWSLNVVHDYALLSHCGVLPLCAMD